MKYRRLGETPLPAHNFFPHRAHALAVAAAVCCTGGFAQFAAAQTAAPLAAPMPSAAPAPKFAIKGFQVLGQNPLSDTETTSVLAPFLRADADIETLQKATAALEAAMRDKGFGLYRVALPPQDVGDTVKLNVVKFTVGRVSVEGNKNFSDANVRASVPQLSEGTTPNFRVLARETSLANENPSKQTTVSLRESDKPDQIDATVQVREQRPWSFSISANNSGTENSGRDRVTFAGGYNNLWGIDHTFNAAYTTSVERSSDVKQLGLNYRLPLYSLGGMLGFSATKSDVVGNFGTFSSTGAGQTFGVNYTHSLPPDGGYRGFVTFSLDDKVFRGTQINGVNIGQANRRTRPLALGYSARIESDAKSWGYSAELATNLASGSGSGLVDLQTEDPRVTSTKFAQLRLGANYAAGFADGWYWSARGNLQWADRAVIAGEQFGLGGTGSVRGTAERPISGDRGMLLSVEVNTPDLTRGLRFLAFFDAGHLSNVVSNGTTKPKSDALASVGMGMRLNLPIGLSVSADYGRVIKGSKVPLSVNQSSPQKGDDKLHVNASFRF